MLERDNLFSKPREESEAAPLAAEQAADDAESTTAAMSTEDAIRGPKKPALRFEQHEALVELRSLAQPEPFGQVWTVHEELGRGAFAIVRRATRNGLVWRGSFRAKHDGACSAAVKCFGPSSTLGAAAPATAKRPSKSTRSSASTASGSSKVAAPPAFMMSLRGSSATPNRSSSDATSSS